MLTDDVSLTDWEIFTAQVSVWPMAW